MTQGLAERAPRTRAITLTAAVTAAVVVVVLITLVLVNLPRWSGCSCVIRTA